MQRIRTALALLSLVGCGAETDADEAVATQAQRLLPQAPAGALPAPGDYDGDGCTDVAVKAASGNWYLDYCANGFGGRWDEIQFAYGGSSSRPAPADYDGDGKTDIAVKDSTGMWGIDYAKNGFGVFDVQLWNRGPSTAVPVPADYDGDGADDVAVKDSLGVWSIDFSGNGYGAWEKQYTKYGPSTAVPVPADYDGDGKADLSVKDSTGCWNIDYWSIGGFGAWNEIRCGYGDASAVPVPADYDNDGKADLAVKDAGGSWYVDRAADNFGVWNDRYDGRGGAWSIAVPGHYDFDGQLDLAVKDQNGGTWLIDHAPFGPWNLYLDTTNRPRVEDPTRAYVDSTSIFHNGGGLVTLGGNTAVLNIGERYVIDVAIRAGTLAADESRNWAGVEVDNTVVPEALRIVNRIGSTYAHIRSDGHRYFTLVCSEPGNFPLVFQLRDQGEEAHSVSQVFNRDHGIRVQCVAAKKGLYGIVRKRVREPDGRYRSGDPIVGAKVVVPGLGETETVTAGFWHFPDAVGNNFEVKVTNGKDFSPAIAVNVTVPAGSGVRVDTDLEERLTDLENRGIHYTTYIDYSRGRTVFHTISAPRQSNLSVKVSPVVGTTVEHPLDACPDAARPLFESLLNIGNAAPGALVLMNAMWWDLCDGQPLGYVYSNGDVPSKVCGEHAGICNATHRYVYKENASGLPTTTPLIPDGTVPLFLARGTDFTQQLFMVAAEENFNAPSDWWNQVGNPPRPIVDLVRDEVSDFTYAMQIGNPALVWDGDVVAGGHFVYDNKAYYDWAWPRTSIGLSLDRVYLVVSDGEGVWGGSGSTANQTGRFFRKVLKANFATALDSGLSTELIVKDPHGGLRPINTVTGEDAGAERHPFGPPPEEIDGGIGAVQSYIMLR